MPNFQTIKVYSRNYAAGICGNYHESCFEYTKKNTYLNEATQKYTQCQNFPTPQNPEIKNFKPPQKLQSVLSLAIRSNPEIYGCVLNIHILV